MIPIKTTDIAESTNFGIPDLLKQAESFIYNLQIFPKYIQVIHKRQDLLKEHLQGNVRPTSSLVRVLFILYRMLKGRQNQMGTLQLYFLNFCVPSVLQLPAYEGFWERYISYRHFIQAVC